MLTGMLAVTGLLAQAPGNVRAAENRNWPAVIPLPNGWLPEGVVTGRGPVIYSGSRANGAIYAANLRTGEAQSLCRGKVGVFLSG
jgi:hypothetical protein